MSEVSLSESGELSKALEYDLVRFTMSDMHGVSRGRLIPQNHVADTWSQGFAIPNAFLVMGPSVEFPFKFAASYDSLKNLGNVPAFPQPGTLQPLTWCGKKSNLSVGEVLCESSWKDGAPQEACPRFVARKQLEELDKLGLGLKSSFEMEFVILDGSSKKPVFDYSGFYSNLLLTENEDILLDLHKNMSSSGIDISSITTEMPPGQFEVTLKPAHGIESADASFRFRQATKEICAQHNLMASFESKMESPGRGYNGFHFNHSLWTKAGKDALYDEATKDKLSDEARYWLGGLVRHGPAITALCCPSVNCYQRMHKHVLLPCHSCWGLDDRTKTFRMKVGREGSTYIESRLPSAACNPYLVLAATVAAGLDGLVNKIPAPDPTDPEATELPHTLEEALLELEKDEVIVKALGSQFVEWFCAGKREIDLKKEEK